jgi:hypothetical protein
MNARVLMLCTVAGLCACHRDQGSGEPPPPPKPKPHIVVPVVAKKGPTAEDLTSGMVEAASQGKSLLPVQLKFDMRQRPKLGQVLDIDVALIAQSDATLGDIQVAGGDGITVAADTAHFVLPVIEAGQVYRQSLKVTPTAEGVLLLNMTISLKRDELSDSRTFSIPLIVER